jgi:hypothetical protein
MPAHSSWALFLPSLSSIMIDAAKRMEPGSSAWNSRSLIAARALQECRKRSHATARWRRIYSHAGAG